MIAWYAVMTSPEARLLATPQQIGDQQAKQATLNVHYPDSAELKVASPGDQVWFNHATATRIEWSYGESEAVDPVWAVIDSIKWPFVIDRPARKATFELSFEAREMWENHGMLEIMCKGHNMIQLRLRPRRLNIGPKGEVFSVKDCSSCFVPGSRQWLEVVLNDTVMNWINLSIRTVEGEMLAPPRNLCWGKYESVFWIGEDEYSIRVEDVNFNILGRESAKLRVVRRWPIDEDERLDIEEDDSETPPPIWFKTFEAIKQRLAATEERTSRACALLDENRALDAYSMIELARNSLEEASRRLRWFQWRPSRLWIGPKGAVFTVDENMGVVVPGSRGWVEVILGRISVDRVHFSIRTVTGIPLVSPCTVAQHDEVDFRIGTEPYAIRVERVEIEGWGPLLRTSNAELRVMKRDETAKPQDMGKENLPGKSESNKEDVPINGQTPSISDSVIALIEQGFSQAEQHLVLAESLLSESLLVDGKTSEEAFTVLESARRYQEEVHQGLCWIHSLTGEELMKEHISLIEDLSLIKVHIVHDRPPINSFQRITQAIVETVTGDSGILNQNIEARILETHTIGSRYAFGTIMGTRYPLEKRKDVEPAQVIKLRLLPDKYTHTLPEIKPLEKGKVYWLAITPPIALEPIARMRGESGYSWITFAMPSDHH